jgi:hypothetical protein
MQATRCFICTFSEFATRMRHRQHDRCGRQVIPLGDHGIERHTTTFVTHSGPAVCFDEQADVLPKARDSLINGIVQRFPDEMEQTRGSGLNEAGRPVA